MTFQDGLDKSRINESDRGGIYGASIEWWPRSVISVKIVGQKCWVTTEKMERAGNMLQVQLVIVSARSYIH